MFRCSAWACTVYSVDIFGNFHTVWWSIMTYLNYDYVLSASCHLTSTRSRFCSYILSHSTPKKLVKT